MPARRIAITLVIGLALVGFSLALAADFTQPERTPDFVKSCRRQDSLLKHAFGDLVPTAVTFCHRGSFKAVVHRLGLERPVTLVPVQSIPYASADDFRTAARKKPVVVGALNITYPLPEGNVIPGAHVLLYDGVKLRIVDAHGYAVTEIDAGLGDPARGAKVDPVVGVLDASPYSLADISTDCEITLYLQLTAGDRELRTTAGFAKVALSGTITGLVKDDNTPETKLATPKPETGTGAGMSSEAK
jgi:hypothetical protein